MAPELYAPSPPHALAWTHTVQYPQVLGIAIKEVLSISRCLCVSICVHFRQQRVNGGNWDTQSTLGVSVDYTVRTHKSQVQPRLHLPLVSFPDFHRLKEVRLAYCVSWSCSGGMQRYVSSTHSKSIMVKCEVQIDHHAPHCTRVRTAKLN